MYVSPKLLTNDTNVSVRFLTIVATFCTSLAREAKLTARSGTQPECVWTKVATFT